MEFKMNNKSLYLFIFLFLVAIYLLIFPDSLFAQDSTIIVSSEESDSENSVDQFATTYDEQQLSEEPAQTVAEFLSQKNVVYIAYGSDDSEIGYFTLRGFSSARVAIFLDGVPVSLNYLNALRLPLSSIKKIMIYKGNVSALFGPNAVGGAIVIWTKSAKDQQVEFINADLSSILNFSLFFHLSSFSENFISIFDIQAKYYISNYNESFGKNDFYDIFLRYNCIVNEQFNFNFLFDIYRKFLPNDIQFPYENTYQDSLFSMFTFVYRDFIFNFQYDYQKFICNDYIYDIDESRQYLQVYLKQMLQILNMEKLDLNLSLSLQSQYLNDESLSYDSLFRILSSQAANLLWYIKDDLAFSLTVSIDIWGIFDSDISFYFIPSAFLGLSKSFDFNQFDSLNLYLRGSTGYRFASFEEMYLSYGFIAVGNEDLLPEKSIGAESGLELKLRQDILNLSIYYYNYDNFIVWVRRFDNRWKPLNFENGYSCGIDFFYSHIFTINENYYIEFDLTATLTISRITKNSSISSEVFVPYIPIFNSSTDLVLAKLGKIKFMLQWQYCSLRYLNIENYNYLESYNLINLSLNCTISERLVFNLALNNLLGTTYYSLLYYPSTGVVLDLETIYYF
jgi:outer membrane receptor protein involved in Fe transport